MNTIVRTADDPTDGRSTRRSPAVSWLTFTIVVLIVAGMVTGLFPLIQTAREAAVAPAAQCPLNQFQLALRNYHQTYGCFPPAYIADEQGRPMHSWRVLLLPFFECQDLYAEYRFDELWDGPNNRKLADKMPQIYHILSEPPSTSMTNVVVIVGPETAFPGSKSTRDEEFRDGLDNTILLTEIAGSAISESLTSATRRSRTRPWNRCRKPCPDAAFLAGMLTR